MTQGDLNLVSMNWSIFIQLVTGLVNVYGLSLPEKEPMLHSILRWETTVQLLQFVFYVVTVKYFYDITSLASMRYYEWVITTPVMLLSIAGYMTFLDHDSQSIDSMSEFVKKHREALVRIALYNFLMLLFGYLGEAGYMDFNVATTIGFVFFFLAFNTLYVEFATKTYEGKNVFWVIFVLWSLYGVAAWMPTVAKNVSFNILDIFAKNMFGLFIAYKVIQLSVTQTN
jgi:hypothetical protein